MNRQTLDILNRMLEFLDDLERDPDVGEYIVDKAATLTEDIEGLLAREEIDGD